MANDKDDDGHNPIPTSRVGRFARVARMASGVAGPESGYAWEFDKDVWDANGALPDKQRADLAWLRRPRHV